MKKQTQNKKKNSLKILELLKELINFFMNFGITIMVSIVFIIFIEIYTDRIREFPFIIRLLFTFGVIGTLWKLCNINLRFKE